VGLLELVTWCDVRASSHGSMSLSAGAQTNRFAGPDTAARVSMDHMRDTRHVSIATVAGDPGQDFRQQQDTQHGTEWRSEQQRYAIMRQIDHESVFICKLTNLCTLPRRDPYQRAHIGHGAPPA
jgi:hypothetical protein